MKSSQIQRMSLTGCVHSMLLPFQVMSLLGCVHSRLCPSRLCPFQVFILGCIHSRLCPSRLCPSRLCPSTTFLKRNEPLKILRNKLNMKNIGTKSINMSETMVYLAMFSTPIDKIICFMGQHNMKTSHYFSVLDTLWNLKLANFLIF